MTFLLFVFLLAGETPEPPRPCPAAMRLPQLHIDTIQDPAVPVIDDWQVFWENVPISDSQLAMMAHDDVLIDRTRAEIKGRGTWVYIGMAGAAAGTAVSSIGWVLYGQDRISPNVTLSLGLGGILLGIAGLLLVTDFIQTPLEPHLAPTPVHRLSREESRQLVSRINTDLYRQICAATSENR